MTAVYLMAVSCLKHREALQVVKHCRPIAAPNSGFTSQLADFEIKRISEVCSTHKNVVLRNAPSISSSACMFSTASQSAACGQHMLDPDCMQYVGQ